MKVCSNCPQLTDGIYCADCAKRMMSEKRSRYVRRDYGKAWRRKSRRVRVERPVCECSDPECCCGGSCNQRSAHVDHVNNRAQVGDTLIADDEANLQALCRRCHSSKTRRYETY